MSEVNKIIQIQEDYKQLKIKALQYCSSDEYIRTYGDQWARDILDNVIDKQNAKLNGEDLKMFQIFRQFDWYEVMIDIPADDIEEMIDIFESDTRSNPMFVRNVMLDFQEVA
jgi:hypothetical protein